MDSYCVVNKNHATHFWVCMMVTLGGFIDYENRSNFWIGASTLCHGKKKHTYVKTSFFFPCHRVQPWGQLCGANWDKILIFGLFFLFSIISLQKNFGIQYHLLQQFATFNECYLATSLWYNLYHKPVKKLMHQYFWHKYDCHFVIQTNNGLV